MDGMQMVLIVFVVIAVVVAAILALYVFLPQGDVAEGGEFPLSELPPTPAPPGATGSVTAPPA